VANKKPLIVFDIGNVLLGFSFERAARNFDRAERGSGRGLVEDLWKSGWGRELEKGRITGRELFRRLKKKRGLRMSYRRFRDGFNDIFTPIRPTVRLFERLAGRFPVALLSNTNAVHWRFMMRRYPFLRRARWPVASHQVGVMKPDPRIYRHLARRSRTPLGRMIYVDDLAENVRAARRLGVRAVHYVGPEDFRARLRRLLPPNGFRP
jgi:HAD superfamily hydrolase (TIGR01509 family)